MVSKGENSRKRKLTPEIETVKTATSASDRSVVEADIEIIEPIQQVKRKIEEDADSDVVFVSHSKSVNQKERRPQTGRLRKRTIVSKTLVANIEVVPIVHRNEQCANLAPRRNKSFNKWTYEEMGEWIVEAAKWDKGKEVFLREHINGGNMIDLIDEEFLKDWLKLDSGVVERVKRAAQAMLDSVKNN